MGAEEDVSFAEAESTPQTLQSPNFSSLYDREQSDLNNPEALR